MSCWERGIIKKRIGDMVYIVEGPKYTHKRHQNQLQKCRLNDSNDVPQTEEEPIDTVFDMFDLDPPQPTPEIRRSGRKKKFTDPLMIDPKRKKILTVLLRSKRLGGGVLWESYPSYHNGLFSPLLVLEISLPDADQYRSEPLQLPGSASADRVICGTDLAECVSVPGDFLRPQGAFPPGFYPLSRGVGFIAWRLRRP